METRVAVAIATIILEDMFRTILKGDCRKLANRLKESRCTQEEIRETLQLFRDSGSVIQAGRAAMRYAILIFGLRSKKLDCNRPGELLAKVAEKALLSWEIPSIAAKEMDEGLLNIPLIKEGRGGIEATIEELRAYRLAEEFAQFIGAFLTGRSKG